MERFQRTPLYILINITALLLSIYLLWHHLEVRSGLNTGPSFCSLSEFIDCDRVAKSSWSEIGSIPVASFGVILHLILLGVITFPRPTSHFKDRDFGNLMLSILTVPLFAVVALFLITTIAIRSICILCVAEYICVILLFALALSHPDRTGGFFERVKDGVKLIVDFFSEITKEPPSTARIAALLTISGVILVILGALLLPANLQPYIKARAAANAAQSSAAEAVALWNRAPTQQLTSDSGEHVLGDGKFEVVVFSDFQCPYCKRIASFLESLAKSGIARIVFKHYPLDQSCNPAVPRPFHDRACRLAELAVCFGQIDQSMFWKAHDAIFNGSLSETEILELAGAERGQVERCLSDQEGKKKVSADITLGNRLELPGTPVVYINGKLVSLPSEEVIAKIVGAGK